MTIRWGNLAITAALSVGITMGASAQEAVKIGVLAGVTGPLASFVPPMLDSVNLAVDQVNANGGLLDGRSMEIVIADTQAAAQPAVDAANKLVGVENVAAIWGALSSGATLAAATSVAMPNKVVMLSPTATSPEMTTLDDDGYIFRVVASDDYQGKVLAKIVQEEGLSKVAVTYVNNDYGVGIARTFIEAFKAAGGEITGEQKHEEKSASYRSELATLANGEPEALVVIAYAAGSGITIVRQSLENGLFERFVGTDGLRDNKLIEELGEENLGTTFFSSPTSPPGTTALQTFQEAYAAAYDTTDDKIFIEQSYDAAFLLALAIEQAGSADRTAIRDALSAVASPPGEVIEPGEWAKAKELIAAGTEINYEGVGGSLDFDDVGDVTGYFGKFVVEDGSYKEVDVYQ
ncbi:MAG: ABC transporter substrate-binding protein [Geminicoccaceae bacterium]